MSRRRFWRRATAVATATGLAALGLSRRIEGRQVTVPAVASGLCGLRIVFVTDLHRSDLVSGEEIRRVAQAVARSRPDVLVLGGDLVTAGRSTPRMVNEVLHILGKSPVPLGRWVVRGNHDIAALGPDALRRLPDGWNLLENQGVRLEYHGTPFGLAGVDDLRLGRPSLEQSLRGLQGVPTIAVSHHPDMFMDGRHEPSTIWFGLAGHLHGGQVRVPGIGAPLRPTAFPHVFDHGWSRGAPVPVWVSRGTGVVGVPFRFFCRPEVTVVVAR